MTVSIVACGPSAKDWYKIPVDFSVGCNDCLKFGHQVDYLVVINSPLKFYPNTKNNHTDRLKIITESTPKKFYCHNSNWRKWFPNYELLVLKPFMGSVNNGRVYSSVTSPFTAITLAASMGANEIILWGVDFQNHPSVKGKILDSELKQYKKLFEALEDKGVRCWLGTNESILNGYLPVWEHVIAL